MVLITTYRALYKEYKGRLSTDHDQLKPQLDRLKSEMKLARICAMITNIDENVGRLFEKLPTQIRKIPS